MCALTGRWVLAVLMLASLPALAQVVIYPRSESAADSQYRYDYELLRRALQATETTHGPFELRESEAPMNQARAAEEVVAGKGLVSIFARSTTQEHEQRMLPIRIPIDKGLISYRVFLIRADMQPQFAAVQALADLRRYRVGSFVTWADTRILREAGFDVVTGDNYEGLFRMLMAQRFDFFSRGVDEALREHDERRTLLPDMRVESELLLYFPTTRFFFVQRSAAGEKLAARVETGLERMVRDGGFEAYFRQYKGALIERAGLEHRRVLRIDNPFLSPETLRLRSERPELWFDPSAKR